MVSYRDVSAYRRDAAASGNLLTPAERESLLKKYLPARDDEPTSAPKAGSSSAAAQRQAPLQQQQAPPRRKPIRSFLKSQLYLVVFVLVQLAFGLYIRLRRLVRLLKTLLMRVLYHHHRTPELIQRDVSGLTRLPKHLSVLLTLPDATRNQRRRRRRQQQSSSPGRGGGAVGDGLSADVARAAVDALLDDVAELSAWSAAVGIPLLSVYEPTGALKGCMPDVHAVVAERLRDYFGGARAPTLQVRAPHMPSYLNGDDDRDDDGEVELGGDDEEEEERFSKDDGDDDSEVTATEGVTKHYEFDSPVTSSGPPPEISSGAGVRRRVGSQQQQQQQKQSQPQSAPPSSASAPAAGGRAHLDLLLLSEEDGRATLVDLTKTLAEMSQKGRIRPADVRADLLDAELAESFAAPDPDLLMLFGDRVVLRGYPPWQLRLTEIYCPGDAAAAGAGAAGVVAYPLWLKGLYRFARAQMRLGR